MSRPSRLFYYLFRQRFTQWFLALTFNYIMDSRSRLREWHQTIRRNIREDYFRNVRRERLRQSIEEEQIENIEEFINTFPRDLEKMVKYTISEPLVNRIMYAPYNWIENCQKWLNMRQWSCFLQLIITILCRNDRNNRLQLLQSSKHIICCDFKNRLLDNKISKRHILVLYLDLCLQVTEQLIVIQGDYLTIFKMVIDHLLAQKFQSYQQQLIKLFVILNRFTEKNQSTIQDMFRQLFIKEKWITLKALTFVQDFGFNHTNQTTAVLSNIILKFFINLTQQTKDRKLYLLFQKDPFLQIMMNVFQFPTDFTAEFRMLCFKLVFNLMVQSHQMAIFMAKLGDINQLLAKISCEEEQMLLNEIKTLLQQGM